MRWHFPELEVGKRFWDIRAQVVSQASKTYPVHSSCDECIFPQPADISIYRLATMQDSFCQPACCLQHICRYCLSAHLPRCPLVPDWVQGTSCLRSMQSILVYQTKHCCFASHDGPCFEGLGPLKSLAIGVSSWLLTITPYFAWLSQNLVTFLMYNGLRFKFCQTSSFCSIMFHLFILNCFLREDRTILLF